MQTAMYIYFGVFALAMICVLLKLIYLAIKGELSDKWRPPLGG